jgi:hypothetical protein
MAGSTIATKLVPCAEAGDSAVITGLDLMIVDRATDETCAGTWDQEAPVVLERWVVA